jgi:hypothetical protein
MASWCTPLGRLRAGRPTADPESDVNSDQGCSAAAAAAHEPVLPMLTTDLGKLLV